VRGSDHTGDQRLFNVTGLGKCLLPREFRAFTGVVEALEVQDARTSLGKFRGRLAGGAAILLVGPYPYVDAVLRYCQREQRELVSDAEFAHLEDRGQRRTAFVAERRRRLHRLLVAARGDSLLRIADPPDTVGLQEWLERSTGEATYLIPVRRLQRILTDMVRAREGLRLSCLDASITIVPHVYVPADESVPAMFLEYRPLVSGRRILDMGTGTGVLALLAAQLGAKSVVATDSNRKAVANAHLNVERFGLGDRIEVRGPADLFDSAPGEVFDTILFNAPWICGQPETLYDTARFDPQYRVIDAFIRAARDHLASGGTILLQYADTSQRTGESSIDHLNSVIAQAGLRVASQRSLRRIGRVHGGREHVIVFEINRL